jgi:hypothetical protein
MSSDVIALAHAAKAINTRRAYRFGWADFTDWCRRFDRRPLPATPATVAEYLRILSEVNKVSTLQVARDPSPMSPPTSQIRATPGASRAGHPPPARRRPNKSVTRDI